MQNRYLVMQLPGALARTALFAALWWVLTAGETDSWIVGGPAVVVAGFVAWRLSGVPAWRWRIVGLVRFLPFFLWRSFIGGIDVARRALNSKRPLAPGFIDYRLGLPLDAARVFMINTVSLLPGTLSAEITDDRLMVHALDVDLPILSELKNIESRVADLFGLEVDAGNGSREVGVD